MKQYFQFLLIGFIGLLSVLLAQQTGALAWAAFIGSVGLFAIAAIVSLFSRKAGASIGVICYLLMIPWLYILPIGIMIEMQSFHATVIIVWIPFFLAIFSGYHSVKNVVLNENLNRVQDQEIKPLHKYLILSIHVALTVVWAFSILYF